MTTNPNPDRLEDLRAEYAQTGMVTSDGAVWLFSQVVVLREQVQHLSASSAVSVVPPATNQTAEIERLTAERDELRTAWESLTRMCTEDAEALVEVGHPVGLTLGEHTVSIRTAIEAIGTELRRLADEATSVAVSPADANETAASVAAPVDQAVEEQRLALSEALGLGTGAPWDAIHDRVTELGLPPLDRDPVARRLGLLAAYRAAVLTEAADRYEEILANADTGQDPRYWTAVRDVTLGLRAMADEAEQAGGPSREATEPQPEADDPLRMSEELCPGFPGRCPNLRTVEPEQGVHLGGVRCGCADAPAVSSRPGTEQEA